MGVISDVNRVSDRIMLIELVVGKSIATVLSVYAPQAVLHDIAKDLFHESLQWTLTKISVFEILFVCGNFNGHIGKNADGYEEVHGGRGFGRRNLDGKRILEFAVAHNLVVLNLLFTKRERHLVTYQSDEYQSQIDYILVKQQNIKLVRDIKVIPNEECVTQENLLVSDVRIVKSKDRSKIFLPKRRVWKLQQADLRNKI